MSGGGGSKSKTKTVKEIPIKDVPQVKLKTTGFGGMGYTATPQTYTSESKPTWMQGAWDMPSWGTSAADPSQYLTQESLQPQAYTQPTTTTESQGYDLQALIDQLTSEEEEAPKDPRTMSKGKFLRAYLLNRAALYDKIREYDSYMAKGGK